jgi:hypothetical protein
MGIIDSGVADTSKLSEIDTNTENLADIKTIAEKILGFNIPAHNYIALSYTGSNLTSVVYKTGGAGGTTVATLTLAYTGSQLDSITLS